MSEDGDLKTTTVLSGNAVALPTSHALHIEVLAHIAVCATSFVTEPARHSLCGVQHPLQYRLPQKISHRLVMAGTVPPNHWSRYPEIQQPSAISGAGIYKVSLQPFDRPPNRQQEISLLQSSNKQDP
ncbi:MAG: hypothetical protein CSA75_04080, partial [Sorangium cellulosum]